MPNAKKLPSGNWQVKVYSHTEYVDGKLKRIRKSFTAPTKAEAEYQAALFKRQNKRKEKYQITLSDALDGYINSKDGILSPSTVRGYYQIKRTYLQELQTKQLNQITNIDIQIALNQEKKQMIYQLRQLRILLDWFLLPLDYIVKIFISKWRFQKKNDTNIIFQHKMILLYC